MTYLFTTNVAYTNQKIQRLARKEEKATIKRIVSLSILTLVLAVLLFTVGITLLGKFVDLLGTVFKGKETSVEQVFLAPPVLDNLPEATNAAKIKVGGFISDGDKVSIYLEDEQLGDATIDGNKFSYDGLTLKNGQNRVSAKSFKGKVESNFSKIETVSLNTKEPALTIDSPEEGQTISGGNNRVKVSGKTDSDSQVYANGFLASIGADGKFEVFVPVAEGDSTIEIKALNSAGNTKIEKRKVTYRR